MTFKNIKLNLFPVISAAMSLILVVSAAGCSGVALKAEADGTGGENAASGITAVANAEDEALGRLDGVFRIAEIQENRENPAITLEEVEAAELTPAENFKYRKSDRGICVTGLKDLARNKTKFVKIPTEIDGIPVKEIGDGAFAEDRAAVAVVIPNGVEKVGERAFEGAKKLQYVGVGEGIEEIGADAFTGCKRLTCVNFADNGKELKESRVGKSSLTTNLFVLIGGEDRLTRMLFTESDVKILADIVEK